MLRSQSYGYLEQGAAGVGIGGSEPLNKMMAELIRLETWQDVRIIEPEIAEKASALGAYEIF